MAVEAVFPGADIGRGMYESFYLRAVAPGEPVGVWFRYTVHKRPGDVRRSPGALNLTEERRAQATRPWVLRDPSLLRARHGRRRGAARHAAQAHGALLRRLPDARLHPGGGVQTLNVKIDSGRPFADRLTLRAWAPYATAARGTAASSSPPGPMWVPITGPTSETKSGSEP